MTSQDLIARIQSGDRNAFRELVERHKRDVYFLALDLLGNHHDAEDLSQEVFIRAYRAIGSFRGESRLRTWLYRITVNCAIDSRRRQRLATVPLEDGGDDDRPRAPAAALASADPLPDAVLEDGALQAGLRRALRRLTPRERSVFVLRHYNDLPLREIGAMLDIAEGTVKALLFRAVRRLQKELVGFRPGAQRAGGD